MGACGSSTSAVAVNSSELDSSRHQNSLHQNLVRERTGRNRFDKIYEVLEEIGHGGLCTIKKIRKREESIGGSARKVTKGGPFSRLRHENYTRGRLQSKAQTTKEVLFALKVINLALVQVST